ncbi:unnamed protein product [Bursaphelenchus xylophilus]|uniref:(pine wood nematode) hypothetical protein n=1 Tax=Bursaphelenchus xylophilus TaxID=6326 RepID=A0A1I7RKF9_BURXY|nr:unnamed protein product [Bursaphelenchus xylophilus]CAG9131347.1 unnamed protein product [Bursaphelenchus xylophilus]
MHIQSAYLPPTIIFVVAHICGIIALILVGIWMNFDGKGFALRENPALEFRWHPICMSLSLLFLNGEAIMVYRGLRQVKKIYTKAVHAVLHCISFIIMVLGLKAVWDYHDYNVTPTGQPAPIPNAKTPHSWVGLACASLYGCQLLAGFLSFYVPQTPLHIRQTVMPFHRAGGLVIFAFSLGAVIMGTAEKSAWALHCPPEYGNNICPENFVINFFCLAVLAYGACVFLLAAVPGWIRHPLPSEIIGQSATVPSNGTHSEVHFVHTERVTSTSY